MSHVKVARWVLVTVSSGEGLVVEVASRRAVTSIYSGFGKALDRRESSRMVEKYLGGGVSGFCGAVARFVAQCDVCL
jgi:hypothetical protein